MPIETLTGEHMPSLLARAQQLLGPDAVILQVRRTGSGPSLELVACDHASAAAFRPSAPPPAGPEFGSLLRRELAHPAVPARPARAATPAERTGIRPGSAAARLPDVARPQAGPARPATPVAPARPAVPVRPVAPARPAAPARPTAPQRSAAPSRPRVPVLAEETAAAEHPELFAMVPADRRALRRGPLVIALVGPTGAGKTTTIAKLATSAEVFRNSRVGLLGLDTYRVGAVEQLKTYAEIGRMPMEVVYVEDELPGALKRLAACDVVLVDVPGRGPRQRRDTEVVREWLGRIGPSEVHLTLPVGLQPALTRRIAEEFRSLRVTHLLATKLDECPDDWTVFDLATELGLPMRWVTDGQEVPRDLRSALARVAAARERPVQARTLFAAGGVA